MRDTTAVQLMAGRDIQGIPWELTQYSREGYRVSRLARLSAAQRLRAGCLTSSKTCTCLVAAASRLEAAPTRTTAQQHTTCTTRVARTGVIGIAGGTQRAVPQLLQPGGGGAGCGPRHRRHRCQGAAGGPPLRLLPLLAGRPLVDRALPAAQPAVGDVRWGPGWIRGVHGLKEEGPFTAAFERVPLPLPWACEVERLAASRWR